MLRGGRPPARPQVSLRQLLAHAPPVWLRAARETRSFFAVAFPNLREHQSFRKAYRWSKSSWKLIYPPKACIPGDMATASACQPGRLVRVLQKSSVKNTFTLSLSCMHLTKYKFLVGYRSKVVARVLLYSKVKGRQCSALVIHDFSNFPARGGLCVQNLFSRVPLGFLQIFAASYLFL